MPEKAREAVEVDQKLTSIGINAEQTGKFPFHAFEFTEPSTAQPTITVKDPWDLDVESDLHVSGNLSVAGDAIITGRVTGNGTNNEGRNRVVRGLIGPKGLPAFINESATIGSAHLETSTPMVMRFASGYDANGYPLDYRKVISADADPSEWAALRGTKDHYLYMDYDAATGAVSYGDTPQMPEYSSAFSGKRNMLIHFDSDPAVDEYEHPLTISGAAYSTAQKKFGTGSYLFDGANDYIDIGGITADQFYRKPWTIELWFRPTDDTTTQYIIGNSGTYGIIITYNAGVAGDYLTSYYSSTATSWDIASNVSWGTTTILKDTWYKLTVEWDGEYFMGYLNGRLEYWVKVGEPAKTSVPTTSMLEIGNYDRNASNAFYGYIDEYRAMSGNCRFGKAHSEETEAFTPDAQWFDMNAMKHYEGGPTTGWTEKKRVFVGKAECYKDEAFHLHCEESDTIASWWRLIDECGNRWGFGGNAQFDTSNKKFGNSSILFDGDNDYIVHESSSDSMEWDRPWTVELWWATHATATDSQIMFCITNTANYGTLLVYDSDGRMYLWVSSNGSSWNICSSLSSSVLSWTQDQFYKITMEWDGSYYKVYRDGVEVISQASTSSLPRCRYICMGRWTSGTYDHNGWVDEIRVTRGHCVYGGAHTPETSALSTLGGIYSMESLLSRNPDTVNVIESPMGVWHAIQNIGHLNMFEKTSGWVEGDFYASGAVLDFSPYVPKGTRAVRCSMFVDSSDVLTSSTVFSRKYKDRKVLGGNVAGDMDGHQPQRTAYTYAESTGSAYNSLPNVQFNIIFWLNEDLKAELCTAGTNYANIYVYVSTPREYME